MKLINGRSGFGHSKRTEHDLRLPNRGPTLPKQLWLMNQKRAACLQNAERLNLKYFLEVFIARDFIESWTANCDTQPTLQQKCARLIEYAANDA